MARLCEELAAALLAGDPLHDSLQPALLTSLPGVSCLSVSLAGANAQALRSQPLLEAGSLRRGFSSITPAGHDTACWHAFSTGKAARGKDDGVDNATKARYRDWAVLHQKYGAAAFLTVPLETGAGIMGALTAAGGPKMDRRAVEGLACRLAEALLRRTTEGLLRAATEQLEDAGGAESARRLMAKFPQVIQRADIAAPPALDLRCVGAATSTDSSSGSSAGPSPAKDGTAAGSPAGSGSSMSAASPRGGASVASPKNGGGPPPPPGASPFMPIALAAAAAASPRSSMESMRASSFEQYQELKYFCLVCRAENCVDLPQWHWGQLVDQLCSRSGRRASGGLSAATAPAGMRSTSGSHGGGAASVASPSHAVASAGMARMARLAALCAREDEEELGRSSTRSSTRVSSTTDLTHPAAQRAASGQLKRISPRDLSESPGSSPASSRSASMGSMRAGSGGMSLEAPSPPATPTHARRPPLAPQPEETPLRTMSAQSGDSKISAREAVMAYTAGLRRRSDTHGPGAASMINAAAVAARRKVATGTPDGADGVRAVSSYVDNLRRASRDVSGSRWTSTSGSAFSQPPSTLSTAMPPRPSADEDLSTGSLRAGSVFEDETARDAVAAYKAARAAPGAPAMGGRRAPSPPEPQHQSVSRTTPPGGSTRASTTRPVADKSAEGVAAARTMVDDYMASLQTRSLAAAADRQVPPASPPKAVPTGRFQSHSSGASLSMTPPSVAVTSAAPAAAGSSGSGAQSPGAAHAAGARSVVDSYLAGLRSRSLAAKVNRAGSGNLPAVAGSTGAASMAAASDAPGGSPGDARATVDAYMSSLRKQSAAVAHARAQGSPTTSPPLSLAAPQAAAEPADPQVAMADYMKSLRRHSVAQAATEAARRVSQEPSDTDQAAADAIAAVEGQAADPAASEAVQPSLPPPHTTGRQASQQRRRHSQPYPDPFAAAGAAPPASQAMSEARAAVTAHMEALRLRSASTRLSSGGSSSPSGSSRQRSGEPQQQPREASVAAAAAAAAAAPGEAPAGDAAGDAAAAGRPVSRAPVEDLAAAKTVVSTYMTNLRRRSAAMSAAAESSAGAANPAAGLRAGSLRAGSTAGGGGGGMDLRSVAAAASAAAAHAAAASSGAADAAAGAGTGAAVANSRSSSSGSETSREGARIAVANYMENLRARGASGAAGGGGGTSVRSSGSLRSGSLRLASIQLDPVKESLSQEGGSADLDQQQQQQQPPPPETQPAGASDFEWGAAEAGGQSSKEPDDPVEAAAEESEAHAAKVVATYIESLKTASMAADAPPGKKRSAIRMDFGGDTGFSVAVASATSSIQSSTGSFMHPDSSRETSMSSHNRYQSPSGEGPTAATAVSAYMAALKQRAAQAAAGDRGKGNGSGGGSGGGGDSMQTTSAPDAKSAVDAYLEGLKSRSAQAAILRRMSSSSGSMYGAQFPMGGVGGSLPSSLGGSIHVSSMRAPSGFPAGPALQPQSSSAADSGVFETTSLAQLSVSSEKMSRLSLGSGSLRVPSLAGGAIGSSGGSLQVGEDHGNGWQRRASLGGNPGGLETLDEAPSGELAEASPKTSPDADFTAVPGGAELRTDPATGGRHVVLLDTLEHRTTSTPDQEDSAAAALTEAAADLAAAAAIGGAAGFSASGGKHAGPAIEPVSVPPMPQRQAAAGGSATPEAE